MKAGSSPPPTWLRLLLFFCVAGPLAYARYRAVTGWGGLGMPCPFRAITGLPCPFCFGTKAWILMMDGQFQLALTYNPLGVLLFAAAILSSFWLFAAMVFRLPAFPITKWTQDNRFWFGTLLIILSNWAYSLTRFLLSG